MFSHVSVKVTLDGYSLTVGFYKIMRW